MISPFFSILIPTRNRAYALEYSIKTILNQTFTDFELIISDNSVDNLTNNLMKQFNDDRIRYYKTNGKLSMVDNFEFSLNYITGKYAIFLGDDDGLSVDALSVVYKYIQSTSSKVITFKWIGYNWPNQISPKITPNEISISLSNIKEGSIDCASTLKNVLDSKAYFYDLPLIYSSFVSTDLIKPVIASKGRFFNSVMLDIYSGILICHLIRDFYRVNKFLGIRGTCGSSNGSAFSGETKENKVLQDDFKNLNKISSIQWNEQAPFIIASSAFCFEAYLQFCNHFRVKISQIKFALFYFKCIRRTYFSYPNEEVLRINNDLEEIKRVIDLNKNLRSVFRFLLHFYCKVLIEKNSKRKHISLSNENQPSFGLKNNFLIINGEKFNLKNILDVQNFIAKLLN